MTGPRRRGLLAWVPLLAILASCLSCGGGAPAGGAGRRHGPVAEEPVLHVYNWDSYIGSDTVARFERATGIRVVYDLYDSNEALEAKLLVGDSGYDIVSTSMAYYARQIRAGLYEPLDRRALTNWGNLDPQVLWIQARADPGNRYAAPYLHATDGFAYNRAMVLARVPNAPLDSLDMLFRPDILARLADCGVSFLDAPEDVLPLALIYLHRDPNSHDAADMKAAEQLVMKVRPYIRVFDSSDYWRLLASGELCLGMGWSSDYSVALARARQAGLNPPLAFTVPREGALITYNALLIPAGAPHPGNANRFINFILQPQVIADITNEIHYGNDNLAARGLVDPQILNDPAVYPPPQMRARLYLPTEFDQRFQRLRTRTWTRIKSGL
ncbi:MAG: polyamine ABC transporter substrate-binding protein [Proteobacteria bacterium]|nr:polyamine ABC transporter substrate-binding protein [Pseudomonadota bacterium]